MAQYILAIDQGTTGSTALVLDAELNVRGRASREFRQIFPHPGWVEHDVEDIWTSVAETVTQALESAGVEGSQLAAIGLTNQRETVALWDKASGQALHNAIVWQCRRTADQCQKMKEAGHEPFVRKRTGLVIDPYFSGTKMRWLLEHVPGAEQKTKAGDALFGTIDSYLLWRLTAGAVHATDATNASRTLLANLETCDWDDELLSLFGVPRASLPEVRASSGVFGHTKNVGFLPDGVPVAGIAGDQQAALFGQACFDVGESKCTYGTGAFLLMNVGSTPVPSAHGLLTTVAWKIGNEVVYALEGSSFIAGAVVQWLRDGLGIIHHSSEVEALAASVPDSGGVTFVPALAGLGAPHWRPEARGVLSGLERGTTTAHIARAALEGIAFQIHELTNAMRADSGRDVPVFKVDGGASMNGLLMQFQADLLQVPVERPATVETTALGAAFLAGLGVGYWKNRDDLRRTWRRGARFVPQMTPEVRDAHLSRWAKAVERA